MIRLTMEFDLDGGVRLWLDRDKSEGVFERGEILRRVEIIKTVLDANGVNAVYSYEPPKPQSTKVCVAYWHNHSYEPLLVMVDIAERLKNEGMEVA